MVKRFISFKWRILVVYAVTLIVVFSFRVRYPFEGPVYRLSNEWCNKAYQVVRDQDPVDTCITVVMAPSDIQDDSIGILVKKISEFKPRVIAVDYNITDSTLLNKIKIDNSVPVILAAAYVDDDSLQYPINIFDGNVIYAHVSLGRSDGLHITTAPDELKSLPEEVVKRFDSLRYKEYLNRKKKFEVIAFQSESLFYHVYYTFLGECPPEIIKDKIVLLGHFGDSMEKLSPTVLDNTDVHETPVGAQFGSFMLVNMIHTLLGNL